MRWGTKFSGILAVAIIVACSVVGISSALAGQKIPTHFFACVTAQHQVTKISTSASLTCAHEVKVSWNARGVAGSTGRTGPQGPAGAPGQSGLNGSVGPRGATGAQGVAGATGARGLQGPTGATGATGASGATRDCSATPSIGSDFADCNLGNFNFNAQDYDGANFSGIQSSFSTFNGGTGNPTYLGPAINASSSMRNTDFSGADLQHASLYSNSDFTNANFTGADLLDAFLYGGAIFTNANFTGANLAGAYLYGGANFTNANFTGANLTGAFLSQSTLSSAVWNDTTCPGGTNSSAYTPQTCVGH